MNKTLLLFIVDFLFLNLIALTRWERAEPARPLQPPVNEISANTVSKDQDLVEAMRQSLADEQLSRQAVEQKLASVDSTLASRERSLGQLQSESLRLTAQLVDTQRSQADLNVKYQAEAQEGPLTRSQLAQLQRDLEDKKAEAERQKVALAGPREAACRGAKQVEGLTVAVAVGEREKQQLVERTAELQGQIQTERSERIEGGAGQQPARPGGGPACPELGRAHQGDQGQPPHLCECALQRLSGEPGSDDFSATRKGLFGENTRDRETKTVFTTDGRQVYALVEVEDTAFSFREIGADWQKIGVRFDRPPDYRSTGSQIEFLSADPRVVVVPVDAQQVAALDAKVYPLAADPFKFPEAVLISGGARATASWASSSTPTTRATSASTTTCSSAFSGISRLRAATWCSARAASCSGSW